MNKKTVAAFGEILWDLLPGASLMGGAPFNFIYRIHSLGDRGVMMSRLGRDDLGDRAFSRIGELGLDISCIQRDDVHPTGTVPVTIDGRGDPDFYIVPDVAYDYIDPDESMTAAASGADCICFGTLVQRTAHSRATLARLLDTSRGALRFLDINLRKDCFSPKTVLGSLDCADVLKLNDDEVLRLIGMCGMSSRAIPDFCREAAERWSLSHCLVTLGGDGVFAYSPESGPVYIPGYRVTVADTIGSGDSFSAGFVHRILRGDGLRDACAFGNVLGALVASKPGGTAEVSPSDIEALSSRRDAGRNVRNEFERYAV